MELSFSPLFLLPIIAGYLFVINSETTRYKVVREDGHRLYFRSTFHGYWIATSIFIVIYLICHMAYRYPPKLESIALMAVVASPVVAIFIVWLVNFLIDENKYIGQALRENDFDFLLASALAKQSMVMSTMDDGKVYAGFVYETPDPARRDAPFFSLLPVMSGFRTTLGKVEFTTFYTEIYKSDNLNSAKVEDFRILLRRDNVKSLRLFNPTTYDEFQSREAG